MRLSIEVMPKDVPGELIRILTPITDVGGNIITVIHKRDELSVKGMLPVHLTLELENKKQFERILERYKNDNISLLKIDELRCFDEITVGIIGHIVRTDLSDTIDSIDSLGFCKVTDLQIDMPEKKMESCAIFRIELDNSVNDAHAHIISRIKQICMKKDIQIVEVA